MYSTFPSWYPNRAVRRAIRQNRFSRLPGAWATFVAMNPEFVKAVRKGAV